MISPVCKVFKRNLTQNCGYRFIDTKELCTDEIYEILWTCLDLKAQVKSKQPLGRPLADQRVTLLTSCNASSQTLIVQSAMRELGADLRLMLGCHWEKSKFKRDIGKFYSLFSDLVIAQGTNHRNLCELREGASVPVLNLSSHMFVPLQGLAVLMTLQEHFGHLKGLTLGWVGPMGCKLNTLLYLLPKVGANIRYNSQTTPHYPATPLVLPLGQKLCKNFHTTIEECDDPLETIAGTDIIATSKHRQETITIDLKMLDNAKPGWAFMHLLPRREVDVTDEVFNHKKSLVWPLQENIQFAIMGVVLDLLKGYHPVTPKPEF